MQRPKATTARATGEQAGRHRPGRRRMDELEATWPNSVTANEPKSQRPQQKRPRKLGKTVRAPHDDAAARRVSDAEARRNRKSKVAQATRAEDDPEPARTRRAQAEVRPSHDRRHQKKAGDTVAPTRRQTTPSKSNVEKGTPRAHRAAATPTCQMRLSVPKGRLNKRVTHGHSPPADHVSGRYDTVRLPRMSARTSHMRTMWLMRSGLFRLSVIPCPHRTSPSVLPFATIGRFPMVCRVNNRMSS